MLIQCAVYKEGKKVGEMTPAESKQRVDAEPGAFAWVALKDSSKEELGAIAALYGLPELAVEDAISGEQQPKLEEYGDTLFLVARQLEVDASGELKVGEVAFFVGANHVVSVRKGAGEGFTAARARVEREPRLLAKGSAYVFYALIDAVVDRYFPVAKKLEDKLERIEARVFAKGDLGGDARRDLARELYDIKREVAQCRHAVEPLMEASYKLFGGRVPALCEGLGDYFRDISDHLQRIETNLSNMLETIGSAMQTNLALVTIDESVTTKKLAAWAAIFAVSTLLAGVWGMNFKTMPELQWEYGYPVALGLMAAVSAGMWSRFRKAGWV